MAGKDAAGTLEFGQSSTIEGFASKAVSSDNDANPSVIVRELVQNSLDAARLAEREQVKVAFVFDEIKLAATSLASKPTSERLRPQRRLTPMPFKQRKDRLSGSRKASGRTVFLSCKSWITASASALGV